MMGTALLKRSQMTRYALLMVDIRDQFGFGSDIYPKTLTAGHDMLEDYARSRNLNPKKKNLKTNNEKETRDDKKGKQDTGVIYS